MFYVKVLPQNLKNVIMDPMIHFLLYLAAFVGIWVGSGIAIRSVEQLSRKLKLSSFAVSFLVLGFFTSISEMSVGINSIVENNPEIYVGNLIGASIVILLFVVPLLAITGKKITIAKEFQGFNLLFSLIVIGVPVILAFDGKIDRLDSIVTILLYAALVFIIQKKKGIFENLSAISNTSKSKTAKQLVKIILGIIIVFTCSHYIVEETLYFAQVLNISPFLISLLLISIGTNIPELSIVVRSAFLKNNQVAFGDYIGSSTFNTFLLGALTLASGKTVYMSNSYAISLLFLIVGLILFYIFARTRNTITWREGLVLLCIYLIFMTTEITTHI
jgi:cation:H+ antiporter